MTARLRCSLSAAYAALALLVAGLLAVILIGGAA